MVDRSDEEGCGRSRAGGTAHARRQGWPGGLPDDACALRALAALLEAPEVEGAPPDLAVAPGLAWLAALSGPGLWVRVGPGGGGALEALARAAERLGPGAAVLAAPWGEADPAPARRAAERHPETVRRVEGVGAARASAARGEAVLLSLAEAHALGEWADVLSPGGIVAIDDPEADAALREALGPDGCVERLGPFAVGARSGSGPLGRLLADPAVAAPLGAVLARLGRAWLATAAAEGPGDGQAPLAADDGASSRAAAVAQVERRALDAVREADRLRAEAVRVSRLHDRQAAAIAAATARRERELARAEDRVAALEATVGQLEQQIALRFEEIAVLTQERMAEAEGP